MTPAELRELAAELERTEPAMGQLGDADGTNPAGCWASVRWVSGGPAYASVEMPNGEEPPLLIGQGKHPSSPSQAIKAAALRAKAWLMENANG